MLNLIILFFFQVFVPLDHQNPGSKKIPIHYSFENEFVKGRETLFLLEDPLDVFYQNFDSRLVSGAKLNVVKIHGRYFSDEIEKLVMYRGSPNWGMAYQFYNQYQVAQDIELVRQKLLGDQKVLLAGHSSSAAGLLHYMSTFPKCVSRSILMSPLLLDVQQNLNFTQELGRLLPWKPDFKDGFWFDFAWHASTDFSRFKEEDRTGIFYSSLIGFLLNQQLFNGFSGGELADNDFALKIRVFELSYGLTDHHRENNKFLDPIGEWMRHSVNEVWEEYEKNPFSIHGNHYDQGELYLENVLIIGGKYDLLVNPKSYEALAEFFPSSTLVLINDGHGLNRLKASGLMERLLLAFLENSVEKKIQVFEAMKRNALISR